MSPFYRLENRGHRAHRLSVTKFTLSLELFLPFPMGILTKPGKCEKGHWKCGGDQFSSEQMNIFSLQEGCWLEGRWGMGVRKRKRTEP